MAPYPSMWSIHSVSLPQLSRWWVVRKQIAFRQERFATTAKNDLIYFPQVRHFNETLLEKGIIPHPGIGSLNETDDVRHHAYYQWVPFVLFAQAMMFYVPHLIWRHWEGTNATRTIGMDENASGRISVFVKWTHVNVVLWYSLNFDTLCSNSNNHVIITIICLVQFTEPHLVERTVWEIDPIDFRKVD